ncbi:hypothetical protein K504DRAFT_73326 [Pleomassaria siparia CBS 279.74]|uniref:Uncharacterized protein n=1 Tax=Pleomassaria siparia CBS 279.74 TaxID=1314801 RepID=A0A6G1K0W6_9PLEO|nr:hypothetical protein K504DRAFT_73326 [Pleomassaria siparia CBS 279.74]
MHSASAWVCLRARVIRHVILASRAVCDCVVYKSAVPALLRSHTHSSTSALISTLTLTTMSVLCSTPLVYVTNPSKVPYWENINKIQLSVLLPYTLIVLSAVCLPLFL